MRKEWTTNVSGKEPRHTRTKFYLDSTFSEGHTLQKNDNMDDFVVGVGGDGKHDCEASEKTSLISNYSCLLL